MLAENAPGPFVDNEAVTVDGKSKDDDTLPAQASDVIEAPTVRAEIETLASEAPGGTIDDIAASVEEGDSAAGAVIDAVKDSDVLPVEPLVLPSVIADETSTEGIHSSSVDASDVPAAVADHGDVLPVDTQSRYATEHGDASPS